MSTIESKSTTGQRPLSPHLQVYKWSWTMTMSIVHRVTGTGLYFGTVLLVVWLVAAASGKGTYDSVQWLFGSFLGRLILFGYTWALIHHLFGGLRHFVWEFGAGFDDTSRKALSVGTLVVSVVLTLVIWIVGYAVR